MTTVDLKVWKRWGRDYDIISVDEEGVLVVIMEKMMMKIMKSKKDDDDEETCGENLGDFCQVICFGRKFHTTRKV